MKGIGVQKLSSEEREELEKLRKEYKKYKEGHPEEE